MTMWKRYPKTKAEYAEKDGLVLTARPNGAWSVHDTKHRSPAMHSVGCGLVGDPAEWTIEEARANAEANAELILSAYKGELLG